MAKRHRQHIPQDGSELTAEWMDEAFGKSLGGTIVGVDREVIGQGVGFVGEIHRCRLTWSDNGAGELPASVVVKVPASHAANRAVGEALQAYEREIVAYSDSSKVVGLPMPTSYYCAMDPNPAPWLERVVLLLFRALPLRAVSWLVLRFIKLSGRSRRRYILVMEDIADAMPPSQVEGGSQQDVLSALEVLAAFHAHNWMMEQPGASNLFWPVDRAPRIWQASYLRNRDDFVAQFGDLVGMAVIARLDSANEHIPEMLARLADGPWTLLHGDYRLDNIMYRPNARLTVLDYQLVGMGRAGWDVGYFITTALTPEHRSREQSLLRHYHEALVGAGVADYSWQALVDDVELTKLVLAHRFVCASDTFDTQMAGQDQSLSDILIQRVFGWLEE